MKNKKIYIHPANYKWLLAILIAVNSFAFYKLSVIHFSDIMSPLYAKTTVEKTVIVATETEPEDPDAWVAWRIAKAGLNPLEAMVINWGESRGNDNAYNINNNGTIDLGRWQVNSIHIKAGTITIECAGNYKCATEWAIAKRLNDGNWSAWYATRAYGIK